MYKHLFGPVPSRRLGMSLGIDLVPHKVCSLNCVYCECGRTTNLTDQRAEYVSESEILEELADYFDRNPKPDYITLSGSGEPTLNNKIGHIIRQIVRAEYGVPLAVLTNGTLFRDAQVRRELINADLILPSLDAATDIVFRKINRPLHSIQIGEYIQGLVDFRGEFTGPIWLEVMIIPGLNDTEPELLALKRAFASIQPEKIQINTLDRPGAVSNLSSASQSRLEEIKRIFDFDQTEIIASPSKRNKLPSYRKDVESAIMETIYRRPCTIEDLSKLLKLHENEINKYLGAMQEENKIEQSELKRGVFYKIKNKK